MTLHAVRHISVSIARPPPEVYRYARDPRNLPAWAAGLGRSIKQVDGKWIADSPMGRVAVAFTANDGGILDHDVTLPSGETVHNPMRVIPNGEGSEVVFTLYKRPGVTISAFDADAEAVHHDLQRLKQILERAT